MSQPKDDLAKEVFVRAPPGSRVPFNPGALVERCRCGKSGPLNGQVRAMLGALEAKGATVYIPYLQGDEFVIEGLVPPAKAPPIADTQQPGQIMKRVMLEAGEIVVDPSLKSWSRAQS